MDKLARSLFWLPLMTLVKREIVRFLRQRSRVMGAIGTPLLFWILIGSGIGNSFQKPGMTAGYLEYFFPGTIAMVIFFTAIFSTMSLIEDRREGFMQSVLVAPVSRFAIVGGKVIGGTILASAQGILFLAIAPWIGFSLTVSGTLLAASTIILISFGLTSLGFLFAWKLNSVSGYHAIMNLVMFPMWLLSGAAFPLDKAPMWLKVLMTINPLTYGVSLLREALYSREKLAGVYFDGAIPSLSTSLLITVVFALLFYVLATMVVSLPARENAV